MERIVAAVEEGEGVSERHEAFAQRAGGIGAFLAALLTIFHAGIDYLRK